MYIWSEAIIGIFDASLFRSFSSADKKKGWDNSFEGARIMHRGLHPDDVKSCIITDSNDMYLSSIHYRTLAKRWNNRRKKSNDGK